MVSVKVLRNRLSLERPRQVTPEDLAVEAEFVQAIRLGLEAGPFHVKRSADGPVTSLPRCGSGSSGTPPFWSLKSVTVSRETGSRLVHA